MSAQPSSVLERSVAAVRARVRRAAEHAGRDPSAVRIVAAGKSATTEQILAAAGAGITDVGENRAQDLRDKAMVIGGAVTWHFLGGLQTNKVRYLDAVHLVHSLDRPQEAMALQRRGERLGRSWDVLIEVNVSGETHKQGVAPDEVMQLIQDVANYPLVRIRGLMTMAPQTDDPQTVRPVFRAARRLRDDLLGRSGDIVELSMGMTDDFEVAVEEGATIVRIGRAIFQGV